MEEIPFIAMFIEKLSESATCDGDETYVNTCGRVDEKD